MIENIRGLVSDRKQGILNEQENLRQQIQELNTKIETLDQIKTALSDNDYFMKITPNDAFNLLEELGYKDKSERLDVYMKLVSNDTLAEVKSEPSTDAFKQTEQINDFSFDVPVLKENVEKTVETPSTLEPLASFELNESVTKEPESKYKKYIEKLENPTEELTKENEQLMNSCMQAINESVLSDSNSYFLGDITINKQKVLDNMRKLFTGSIGSNDVLPMLTVGMSYGTTSDETVMDEILDYLKALQVKAN